MSCVACQSVIIFVHATDYRLVIICSSEDEEKSHIIAKLHLHRRPYTSLLPDTSCAEYLRNHFCSSTGLDSASATDKDKLVGRVGFFAVDSFV